MMEYVLNCFKRMTRQSNPSLNSEGKRETWPERSINRHSSFIEDIRKTRGENHTMKKIKKALASLAISSMLMTMVPLSVFATSVLPPRLAGNTAEQTAVAIADQTGWTGTAILASSASYGMVDALTCGPLATFLKAPILLQEAGSVLNADTRAELVKLQVTTVYVASGTAVISQAVINELKDKMHITVVPLGGYDQFETSVNVANKIIALGAPVSKVAVAYGWLTQDALSIASIASNATPTDSLNRKRFSAS